MTVVDQKTNNDGRSITISPIEVLLVHDKTDQNMIKNRYFVRKEYVMGTIQLREELHKYIDQADDRILRLVKGMFQADTDDYTLPDEQISEETLKIRVNAAKSRINSGQFTSQEDLESEMKEW